jgi:hypothetical protein
MYFSSEAGGLYHIWRQRFPDGQPQQVTSGPTEEEGLAMAPDGRSFVTAVALENVSVWVHDARGERRGAGARKPDAPSFTPSCGELPVGIWDAARPARPWSRPLWLTRLTSNWFAREASAAKAASTFSHSVRKSSGAFSWTTFEVADTPSVGEERCT